jgi:hypothetical protein
MLAFGCLADLLTDPLSLSSTFALAKSQFRSHTAPEKSGQQRRSKDRQNLHGGYSGE